MRQHALLVLPVLVLLVSGCASPASNTIKIGGLFGLTGISTAFGTDEQMGTQLAIEEINAAGGINGKNITMISEDTRTDIPSAITAYRKLVDLDKVSYIIGPTWGVYSEALVPFLQEDNAILISPSTGEELEVFKNPNFFKTWPADKLETVVLIEHMKANNADKISTLITEDAFGRSMLEGFKDVLNNSILIEDEFVVSFTENDFRTIILQLKSDGVDAVYVVIGDFSNFGEFFKQMKELGYSVPVYAYSGIENPLVLDNYGEFLDDVLYPIPATTQRDEGFNDKFEARFGRPPAIPVAATAYDAVKVLAIALRQGEDVETVKEALLDVKSYAGASSFRGFNEFGWPVSDRVYKIRTVRNSTFVDLIE